jgi:solute:Na+ symporter, SSS family
VRSLDLERGVGILDWAVVGLYFAVVLGIGWYWSRRQKSRDDYLLGGRRMNPVASGISIIVTLVSLISYLAVVGETVKFGPLYVIATILSLPIIFLIVAYLLIPVFMKLPITSAYEILEKPLGLGVRLTGSVLFILIRVVWMALIVFLSAKTFAVMMNWGEGAILPTVLALGAVTLFYTGLGGFRAAVAAGVVKFFLLFFGAVLTLVFISVRMGGVGAWLPHHWASHWPSFQIFSFNPSVRLTLSGMMIMTIVWWICTAGSDQIAIQRYAATRDLRAARKAFLSNNIADAILTIFLGAVGLAVLAFFQAFPGLASAGRSVAGEADFLFPHLIANILPNGAAGFLMAGVISTVLVSFGSGVNSTAAVIVTDFVGRLRAAKDRESTPAAGGDRYGLSASRIATVAVGVAVLLLSLLMDRVPGNIVEMTNRSNGLFVAPLFNLFFMAIFIRGASPLGTVLGSVYGFAAAFLIAFWQMLTGEPSPGFQWIIPASLVVSILSSIVFSRLAGRPKTRRAGVLWSTCLLFPLFAFFMMLLLRRGGR